MKLSWINGDSKNDAYKEGIIYRFVILDILSSGIIIISQKASLKLTYILFISPRLWTGKLKFELASEEEKKLPREAGFRKKQLPKEVIV